MSTRSKARKAALDLLYEGDIRKASASALMLQRITDVEYVIRDFTKELIDGVEANRRKIDELITIITRKNQQELEEAISIRNFSLIQRDRI